MLSRRPIDWQIPLVGLLAFATFASLPEPLGKALTLMATVPLAISAVANFWGVLRREHLEYLAEREQLR